MQKTINEVLPFIAWHYNPEKMGDIGPCLSPPYDVISPEMQQSYYKLHQWNIIRLILNKIQPGDNEQDNRYTRANHFYRQWQDQKILIFSHTPSYWVYEMEYQLPGTDKIKLKGFIGLVKLADFDELKILPHEKIMKTAYEDRIKLTRMTNTQLEYIWGFYRDKNFLVDKILEKCEQQPRIIDYSEKNTGVRHSLWQLSDKKTVAVIRDAVSKNRIFIADGHHRYNTMLAIRDEFRQKYPGAGENAPWEYIMMFLTNSEHEGLTVFPTHRLVYNLDLTDRENLINEISRYFEVKQIQSTDPADHLAGKRAWLEELKADTCPKCKLGLYLPGHYFYVLSLQDQSAYEALYKQEYSRDWKYLDVNILNTLLLKKILGISEEQLALNTHLKYTINIDEALSSVDSGQTGLAVILNPTPLDQIIAVSNNMEMMPRKSTYFFPKPVSGLVMYEMKYGPIPGKSFRA